MVMSRKGFQTRSVVSFRHKHDAVCPRQNTNIAWRMLSDVEVEGYSTTWQRKGILKTMVTAGEVQE